MIDGTDRSASGEPAGAAVREAVDEAELAKLWLATLREVAGRGAHEVRGALNGVALNLEVVRARAEKAGAVPAAIASFAAAAADQLEVLTERTEALVALSRAARRPFDVRVTTRHLVALLAPAMQSTGGSLGLVDGSGDATAITDAEPERARLVLAAILLAASEATRALLCRIAVGDAIIVRVEGAGGPVAVAPDVLRAASDAGIGVEQAAEATIVAFPAAPR